MQKYKFCVFVQIQVGMDCDSISVSVQEEQVGSPPHTCTLYIYDCICMYVRTVQECSGNHGDVRVVQPEQAVLEVQTWQSSER